MRDGSDVEFDLDDTIHATANNGGWLDVRMRPERHNKIRVLLLMAVSYTHLTLPTILLV